MKIKRRVLYICNVVAIIGMVSMLLVHWYHAAKEMQWQFPEHSSINRADFPQHFIWGIADSAYQVEGPLIYDAQRIENNWTRWEREPGRITHGQTIGDALGRWEHYKEVIDLMASLGFTAYRFSIPWDKVEHEQGLFDTRVLDHYRDVISYCKHCGITPMICLLHFTYPTWFEGMGAFEHTHNIHYFTRFAQRVYQEFHNDVSWWLTMNEPTAFASAGYFTGNFPPGKRSFFAYRRVLYNLLAAHAHCYRVCKEIDDKPMIGLCNNNMLFDVYHWWNPIEHALCYVLQYFFGGDVIAYFKHAGNGTIDFYGLNYYTHVVLKQHWYGAIEATHWLHERVADNGYGIYPEGLCRMLHQLDTLQVPLQVTENGVADAQGNLRPDFIQRHLIALRRALSDGINVQGYWYWTLFDNWEWDQGYTQKFGIYLDCTAIR